MGIKIARITFVIITLALTAPLFGGEVTFSIRYQNKEVYYPDKPVWIKASIRNDSAQDYVFQLADELFLNIDLQVKTLSNQALEPSDLFLARSVSRAPVMYRLMNLKPGEEHSFSFDVREFVNLNQAGTYIIQAVFVPNAAESSAGRLNGNSLSLSLRPYAAESYFVDAIDADDGEILQREALAPDQVVKYTLEARQREQWNKFFLYIDLEEMYKRNSDRRRRFLNADITERLQMIKNYSEQLAANSVDGELSNIPFEFKVLSVTYTDKEASVITRQVYRLRQYNEVKEYTWLLRNYNGVWMIKNYIVKNLGSQ